MTEKEELGLRAALTGDPATYRTNWLVEAGAGAGKTHLIVERMVNQLATGFCDHKQLVAITFTNKATNQLRERLTNTLLARRNQTAGDEFTRLEEVLRRMDEIQISTIHSFCQRLLREMPLETGLPFSFTLQDEEESSRYRTHFFNACCRDHADWFAAAQDLGIQPSSLVESFRQLLACGDEEIVCLDDAARKAMEQQAVRLAEAMRQDWTGGFSAAWPSAWRTPVLEQLLSYPPITCFRQVPGWLQLAKQFAGMKQPRETKCTLSILKSDGKTEKFDIQLVAAAQAQDPLSACWNAYQPAYNAQEKARKAGDGHGHQRALGRRGGLVVVDAAVEQAGVQVAGHHLGAGEQETAEVDVGAQAQHVRAGERGVEAGQGLGAVGAVGDDLAEHGVVVTADDGADPQPGVHADAAARRLFEP